jgi:hypothetical protein
MDRDRRQPHRTAAADDAEGDLAAVRDQERCTGGDVTGRPGVRQAAGAVLLRRHDFATSFRAGAGAAMRSMRLPGHGAFAEAERRRAATTGVARAVDRCAVCPCDAGWRHAGTRRRRRGGASWAMPTKAFAPPGRGCMTRPHDVGETSVHDVFHGAPKDWRGLAVGHVTENACA